MKDYGVQIHLIETMKDVAKFEEWVYGPHDGMLCFDTETTGLRPDFDRIRLAQFGDKSHGWAIPFERWGGVVTEVFKEYSGEFGLHNMKFDARQLMADEPGLIWPWDRSHDSMHMAHLFDPTRPKGLKPLAARLVDPQAVSGQKALDQGMRKQKWTWETVPIEFQPYWLYGGMDPVLTSHIIDHFLPKIEAEPQLKALYDLELGVSRVVAKMEQLGVLTDVSYAEQKRQELVDYINKAKIYLAEKFGISAPTPLRLLKYFEENEIPHLVKRSPNTGAKSADKEVLQSIDHEVARTVLAIRKAEKLAGTYLDNFINLRDDQDRLHANFWTMGTRTARMSITDPALQTLPKKDTTVRTAVVPSEGHALVSFDADQIEARLMAIFSRCQPMIDAFNDADANGGDFFCQVASQVYGEEITDKKDFRRQLSKITVYGLIYGGGAETLAANVGVTLETMEKFLQDFFMHYPEVRQLQVKLNNLAKERRRIEGTAYVKTPDGRKMVVDDDKDYTATNYLIQSHAAEILKKKLVLLDSILPESCRILLLVHDEILLEVPLDILEETMDQIQEALNQDLYPDYPIKITWGGDYSTKSWGDLVD